MSSAAKTPRVLVAVLVYNGRDFVPRALESVSRLRKGATSVDVIVLDDHSPEPGWSEELAELSLSHGLGYYRSPRNVGIPRNFNLGVLRAASAGYDHVVLLNSDVVVPCHLVDRLVAVTQAGPRVGSVTAWSNNCSIFSLANSDPDRYLSGQDDVDWVSDVLGAWSAPAGVEIPVGVGFCMLLPMDVVREVGLFDPVFGRGYCEENDWCLRARAAGYRNVLATNVFAYHVGGASTRTAGLLMAGETTVHAHERIIDWRYPAYRQNVSDFARSGLVGRLVRDATSHIVLAAATQWGYDVRLSSLPNPLDPAYVVRFGIRPEGDGRMVGADFRGFNATFELGTDASVLDGLTGLVGGPPRQATIGGRGLRAAALEAEARSAGLPVVLANPYPERI